MPYEPGQIMVVTFTEQGNQAMQKIIQTAGEPHHLVLEADNEYIHADGRDKVFITVSA
jgi:beta-galactosidase